MDLSRAQGRADQILMSLQQLRGNPATPANIAAALEKMNEAYVGRFGQELKLAKDGAISGKYEHDADTFFVESQKGLGCGRRRARCLLRQRRTDPRAAGSSARISFLIALAGLIAVAIASVGLVIMVRRRVCQPIVDLTATMSQLASGDVSGEHSRRRPQRRDRRDGGCRRRLQAQQDRGRSPHRGAGSRERGQDAARPRARRSHPRLRDQGDRTGRRAVLGLRHHGNHRAVDVVDRVGHQPSGRRRGRRLRTDLDQRADGRQRHRRADLLDLGDRDARSRNPPRSRPARSRMPAAAAIPRVRWPRARRRSATS